MQRCLIFSLLLPLLLMAEQHATARDACALSFNRIGVRRFIFSNNLPLGSLEPSEIVARESMHPAFLPGDTLAVDTHANISCTNGNVDIAAPGATFYVAGLNPYATYEVAITQLDGDAEVALDWATYGLKKRVQVIASTRKIALRLVHGNTTLQEHLLTDTPPRPPFTLKAQLYGMSAAVFVTKNNDTVYVGDVSGEKSFRTFCDFRDRTLAHASTFNVAAHVPATGRVLLGSAKSYLSAGIGQADMRLVTHKDGSPYWEGNRIWFTFSARGLRLDQMTMGVMSLDPSLFDFRYEGMIVYDHGDNLLRNDHVAHIIFDQENNRWLTIGCDFGGVAGREGRGGSQLVLAETAHSPLHGFSVLTQARAFDKIPGKHEDPCLIYDAAAKKWRLLTCAMPAFHTELYESDNWDGPYTRIAGPTPDNSTGVQIQMIGGKRYCLSGNAKGPILIYTYPDLRYHGELNVGLQPHWPKGAGRIWPTIFPLPEGFAYPYMAIMMDRPNFPGVKGSTWSYGALYLYAGWPTP